jgi:hypothetical protein
MVFTVSTLITVQTLLISVPIVILSVLNFYFTGHALKTFSEYFPPGVYDWISPGEPWTPVGERPEHKVQLTYDYSPETMILVSTAFSLIAGFFGIAAFWVAKKVSQHTYHLLLLS